MDDMSESISECREKIINDVLSKTINIEERLKNIFIFFKNNREKSTFIVDLWINYLTKKIETINKDLQQCEKAIEFMNSSRMNNINSDELQSLSYETIVLLKLLFETSA